MYIVKFVTLPQISKMFYPDYQVKKFQCLEFVVAAAEGIQKF
jgi:hypothetical protein